MKGTIWNYKAIRSGSSLACITDRWFKPIRRPWGWFQPYIVFQVFSCQVDKLPKSLESYLIIIFYHYLFDFLADFKDIKDIMLRGKIFHGTKHCADAKETQLLPVYYSKRNDWFMWYKNQLQIVSCKHGIQQVYNAKAGLQLMVLL